MPRRSRLVLAGIPVHVIQRGNNRQPCFFRDEDRAFYLFHLGRLLARSDCVLHAYCLMTNHVHLLLTPKGPDGCARLMKQVGQLHTQYINRTYERTGTLWEGRFRSCLVQSETYVLACYRYIEANPIRAGLTERPADYPWSSYRANAEGATSVLVSPHDEYLRLGSNDPQRKGAYRELFAGELSNARLGEIRSATNGNFALGDETFRVGISKALGRRVERGKPGRPPDGEEKRGLSLI